MYACGTCPATGRPCGFIIYRCEFCGDMVTHEMAHDVRVVQRTTACNCHKTFEIHKKAIAAIFFDILQLTFELHKRRKGSCSHSQHHKIQADM